MENNATRPGMKFSNRLSTYCNQIFWVKRLANVICEKVKLRLEKVIRNVNRDKSNHELTSYLHYLILLTRKIQRFHRWLISVMTRLLRPTIRKSIRYTCKHIYVITLQNPIRGMSEPTRSPVTAMAGCISLDGVLELIAQIPEHKDNVQRYNGP